MKREAVLNLIRIAGYHNDSREFARLYSENRISRSNAIDAFGQGQKQKMGGMGCGCYQCKKESSK